MGWYQEWKPYVPVAKRQANAVAYGKKLAKKEGRELAPIRIDGRQIARSFWGQAWCENLESYSDFSNRLPRGRTYARNGSVIDLQIEAGKVKSLVSGSEVYTVTISIEALAKSVWKKIKGDCSQSIESLIDLLQARFSEGVMQRLSRQRDGLFPSPKEISMRCSCPDWAGMCKHVAATMYGVGARLDTSPELLFVLRAVDHLELIGQAVAAENLSRTLATGQAGDLAGSDLGELFGIDLDTGAPKAEKSPAVKKRAATKKSRVDKKVPAAKKTPVASRRKTAEKSKHSSRLPAPTVDMDIVPQAVATATAASSEASTPRSRGRPRGKRRSSARQPAASRAATAPGRGRSSKSR